MKPWAALTVLFLSPSQIAAQDYRASVYGYFTVGACQHSYTVIGGGGGAEGFLWKGLTLGAEGGFLQFVNGTGYGEAYVPVGYHFGKRQLSAKWDPFVSIAPLGLYGANGIGPAFHAGGGVTYWFRPKLGVRTEFRVHALGLVETTGQGRIGITFR